jgi:D-glycero-alpha-D-manno-heptose-7-phosphate kinase
MIISKTPYRISFFGGGSDFPDWYLKNGGIVLSATIDKYIYISCRNLPPFFRHKHRFVYSKIELVRDEKKTKHPVLNKVLNKLYSNQKKNGLEIHYDGDFPARSGMGSSSSFTVGLLNALNNYYSIKTSKKELAYQSIYLEQNLLNERVGSQDQIAAANGGFNEINFFKSGNYTIKPLINDYQKLKNFKKKFVLVFTGTRKKNQTSDTISRNFIKKISTSKKNNIFELMRYAEIAKKLIQNSQFDEIGKLLDETWKIKKDLSKLISTNKVDELYNYGINNGALGGKLLGAGGAGFLLFYVPEEKQSKFIKSFKRSIIVPFNFESEGSKIIFNDQKN